MNKTSIFFFAFALSILISIASQAQEKCNEPEFAAKYATYEAVDKAGPGAPAMAMLAIAGGPQSTHYKKIAELAQKSKVFADLKSFLDVVNTENERAFKKIKTIRDTSIRLSQEFDRAFGKDWDTKPELRQKMLDRMNTDIKASLDLIDESYGRKPSEFVKWEKGMGGRWSYNGFKGWNAAIDAEIAKSPESMKSIYKAIQRFASPYAFVTGQRLIVGSFGPDEGRRIDPKSAGNSFKEGFQGFESARDGNKYARNYRNAIAELTQATATIDRSFRNDKEALDKEFHSSKLATAGKVGAVVAGTVAAGGALAQGVAVDGAKLAKLTKVANECGPKLGIADTGALASSIDPQAGYFERPDCNNLNIKAEALAELANGDGTFKPGPCKLLEGRLQKYQDQYDKDFDFNPTDCSADSVVKVDGKPVGSFTRVSTDQAYFDVAPGASSFGAKFYIQNNGGFDFDPQGIECYRMVSGKKQPVPDCSTTIRNSVQRGSMGGLAVSNFESRQALFHSSKGCRAIGNTSYAEPYCAFSDNAPAIRLANSLYQPACMNSSTGRSGTTTNTAPANSAR